MVGQQHVGRHSDRIRSRRTRDPAVLTDTQYISSIVATSSWVDSSSSTARTVPAKCVATQRRIGVVQRGSTRRKADDEHRSCSSSVAVRSDRAAVRFDDVPDDRKAETESTNCAGGERFAAAKRLENVRKKIRRNPRTGVAHGDFDIGGAFDRFDLDAPACRRELDGVSEQVPPHLAQPRSVTGNVANRPGNRNLA